MCKYVVICGGVVSGVGKGLVAASTALLLKQRNFNVQYIKFDPFYSINSGLLNPNEHGETYVLNGDGRACTNSLECDLDLGHIERITGLTLTQDNICTSGVLFKELIEEQEQGKYLGKTITNKPFITDKIISRIEKLSKDTDVVITEIGGTVDDAESSVFLEAICQLKQKYRNDCLIVLVSPILWLETIEEFKTKPLQRSVRDLQSYGIIPDVLLCRSVRPIADNILDKISSTTNISRDCIFLGIDAKSIYEVPIMLYKQGFDNVIIDRFHMKRNPCRLHKYKEIVEAHLNSKDLPEVTIGIVVKYKNHNEAYLSLRESLSHAGIHNNMRVKVKWIAVEDLEKTDDISSFFADVNGVIVPGGFDARGVAGKIKAIQYARENKLPFLGICLGLQCAVIEISRHLLGLDDANSTEFNTKTHNPVVHFIPGQEKIANKSGTMRLGAYPCDITKGTIAHDLYKRKTISERHRHRYEVNEAYVPELSKIGFKVSGRCPDNNLVEIMELDRDIHPFFLSLQAHPEFQSKIIEPSPPFVGLVKAALEFGKHEI